MAGGAARATIDEGAAGKGAAGQSAAAGPEATVDFFFNETATTEIYTLSLHDALPISCGTSSVAAPARPASSRAAWRSIKIRSACSLSARSEEHTSELQSLAYLVC